jgi:hypothetical protein
MLLWVTAGILAIVIVIALVTYSGIRADFEECALCNGTGVEPLNGRRCGCCHGSGWTSDKNCKETD